MKPATMTTKQKDNHYGKLNDRFDTRCGELVRLGFEQVYLDEYGTSVFMRRDPVFRNQKQVVVTATVMYADDLVWADHLTIIRGK